ncbi:MAG: tetratricopeptide repeat protein, partial [Gammaproteobacteria bacterium]|nr:tetratricopeptide repeat protein [Gammaproteobacteria bacterium]
LRAKQPQAAAEMLSELLKTHPDSVEFIVSRAQADMDQGKEAAALERLQKAVAKFPSSYALNIAFAEAALAAGKPGVADEQLTAYRAFRDDDPRVYELLSRAAGDQGRRSEGHAYLAEYYYLIGDVEAAVLQLDIALKQPEVSFYDASRYESRRAELKLELDDEDNKRSARP